jgi:acyl carrier protein
MHTQSTHEVVLSAAAEVLALDPASIAQAPLLSDLVQFNSFRSVELLENVEARLHIEIDSADLTPANLASVDRLSELCSRYLAEGRVVSHG